MMSYFEAFRRDVVAKLTSRPAETGDSKREAGVHSKGPIAVDARVDARVGDRRVAGEP
jgi:hypothetical protein